MQFYPFIGQQILSKKWEIRNQKQTKFIENRLNFLHICNACIWKEKMCWINFNTTTNNKKCRHPKIDWINIQQRLSNRWSWESASLYRQHVCWKKTTLCAIIIASRLCECVSVCVFYEFFFLLLEKRWSTRLCCAHGINFVSFYCCCCRILAAFFSRLALFRLSCLLVLSFFLLRLLVLTSKLYI